MEEVKLDLEQKETPRPDPNSKLNQPDPKPSDQAAGDDGRAGAPDKASESKPVSQGESQATSELQAPSGPQVAEPPTRTSSGTKKSVHWSPEVLSESREKTIDRSNNPYVARTPVTPSTSASFKDTMETVKGVLGRWGKKVGEATRRAEDLAGNTWQHLKTAPSFADAAMGRIAQSTKVLAEGGHESIFQRTFETVPEEQLQNSFACYLSTSAGPVMGTLYVSTAKLAYCSDNPLSYKNGTQTEWSYYKVVIPLHQMKAINPSTSRVNPSEKYIQVISLDNHEFWFMGFLNYDGAVKCLQDGLQARTLQTV